MNHIGNVYRTPKGNLFSVYADEYDHYVLATNNGWVFVKKRDFIALVKVGHYQEVLPSR